MIDKELEQITEEDLQRLVTNEVAENKTLDYKEKLPGDKKSDKVEFYKDISSFANALGGDIIYGISENKKTRIPEQVKGLEVESVNELITKFSNMIEDGIEQRIIPAPKIQPVELSNGKTVIIIQIFRSWTAPHRIRFQENHKFWIRGNNGKHEMDVTELRNAFNLSGNMEERIQKFRTDRMQKILANKAPILLPSENCSFLILHLIPISSFHPEPQYFDIKKNKGILNEFMVPMEQWGTSKRWEKRNNFDGFLTYKNYGDLNTYYVQFFRNGVIESVRSGIVEPDKEGPNIKGVYIENLLIQSTTKYLNLLKQLTIQPPIFLFLTLTGVRNARMFINRTQTSPSLKSEEMKKKIDRDILQIPELLIKNFDTPAKKLLKPAFDIIWNACGYDGSKYYNDKGERTENNK